MSIEDSPLHEFLDNITFSVVLFDDEDGRKVGIVFEALGHCAVFDVKKLAAGVVGCRMVRIPKLRYAIRECAVARAPGSRVRNGHHQEGSPGFPGTLAVTPWKACRRLLADIGRFLACKG